MIGAEVFTSAQGQSLSFKMHGFIFMTLFTGLIYDTKCKSLTGT